MKLEEILNDPKECIQALEHWPDEFFDPNAEAVMKGIARAPKLLKKLMSSYNKERMQKTKEYWLPAVLESPNISAHLLGFMLRRDEPYSRFQAKVAKAVAKDPTWSSKVGKRKRVPEKIRDILLKGALQKCRGALRVFLSWPDEYIDRHQTEILEPILKSPEMTYRAFTEVDLDVLFDYPEIIERLLTLPGRCLKALNVSWVHDDSTKPKCVYLNETAKFHLDELKESILTDPMICARIHIRESLECFDKRVVVRETWVDSRFTSAMISKITSSPRASAKCFHRSRRGVTHGMKLSAMSDFYHVINETWSAIDDENTKSVYEACALAKDSRLRIIRVPMTARGFCDWIYGAGSISEEINLKKDYDKLMDAPYEVHEGIKNIGAMHRSKTHFFSSYSPNLFVKDEGLESLAKFKDLDEGRQEALLIVLGQHSRTGRAILYLDPIAMYTIMDTYNILDDDSKKEFLKAYNVNARQHTLEDWAESLHEQQQIDVIGGGRYRQTVRGLHES